MVPRGPYLDTGVPGEAEIGSWGAEATRLGGEGEAGEVFDAFVAELEGSAEAERGAVGEGEVRSVHAVGEEGLGVAGFVDVDAIPPTLLEGLIGDEADGGVGAGEVEDVGEGNADPFGDVGPAFLAVELGDVGGGGELFEIGEGEGEGAGDEAVDEEAPIGEAGGVEALEGGVGEGVAGGVVGVGRGGDEVAGELAGGGMGEELVGGVGEGVAEVEDAALVRGDEAIDAGGEGEAGGAGGGGEPGAAGGHAGSFPEIIPRRFRAKPVRATMETWPRKKRTRAEMRKKWRVRADWWPPRVVTRAGKTAVSAGDMARPVQMMAGNRRKMTAE
jgi:hypothetical protein